MQQVIIKPLVTRKQVALIKALLREGYFATEAAAFAYADGISDFINTLPRRNARPTTNNRYGNWYAVYKANRRTSWYILFDIDGDNYIVRNLINNHTPDYPFLISRLG